MTILGQTIGHCHEEFRDVKVREDLMIREQVTEMIEEIPTATCN